MNLAHTILKWEQSKHKLFVLFFRVLLGVIITFKGIIYLGNLTSPDSLVQHGALYRFAESFWVYYAALASLICGILIITGFLTRVAVIMQIPVLIGAVLFINPGDHVFALNGKLAVSLAVLGMLTYFFLKGPGEMSMDNYLRNQEL